MGDEADVQSAAAALRVDWKAKYTQLRARLKEALQEASFARHQVLEPESLRRMLPHRLRTLSARTRARDPAARERAFSATCPAYATREPTPDRIERCEVDGLHWHVPVLPVRRGESSEIEKQQRLPYAAIVRTRDVSIGGVMLDIGANIGGVAIPRVVLGDMTAAYCAEPDPLNYECLRRNVLDNGLAGLVMPDRIAISDHDGVVRFRRAKRSTGHNVVTDANPSGDVVEVPSCTLDSWVARHGIDLDEVTFIKVDVEGHEQRVLDGAPGVLACPHIAWQLEVWASRLSAAGNSATQLAASLARHFTHYIDLRRESPAPRVRPIAELHPVARELDSADGKTDIVVCHFQ